MLSLSKQERAGRVRRVQNEVLVSTKSYPAASAWACSSVTLPWLSTATTIGSSSLGMPSGSCGRDDHTSQDQAARVFAHRSQLRALAGEERCGRHVIKCVGGPASESLIAGGGNFLGDGERALRGVLQRAPELTWDFRRVGG
jgi:hypothetical protein